MGTVKQSVDIQPDLYERDFYEWTNRTARALKARDVQNLDWDNLAEEIESLGRSVRHALKSDLRVLIMHLLKWKTQPERRSASWKSTINEHRRRVNDLLEDSPSLRYQTSEIIAKAYADAVDDAVEEMGLLQNPFPAQCPFTVESLCDIRFWPV